MKTSLENLSRIIIVNIVKSIPYMVLKIGSPVHTHKECYKHISLNGKIMCCT